METNTATPTTTAPAPSKGKATKVKSEKTPLKAICAKLRIEPKAARRKLRKAAGLSFHGGRERWTFTPAQALKVIEILKPSKVSKAAPESKSN